MAELAEFPWDAEFELAQLLPSHLCDVLRQFLIGVMSAQDVESWANAVEGRDDIAVSVGSVQDALHELANPELTEPLTSARARHWILDLKG